MIRSSALYISIIVSVLIVLICGAVLSITYLHKTFDQVLERKGKLRQNCLSGVTILLEREFKTDTTVTLSLYESTNDTVCLQKEQWGIYELGKVTSRIGLDSLKKVFLMGNKSIDSLKVLLIADEDRPVTISGKTIVRGTAYLPKSGIKQGYVDGLSYQGTSLIYGLIKNSSLKLAEPDSASLGLIHKLTDRFKTTSKNCQLENDSITNSFFSAPLELYCQAGNAALSGKTIRGNVLILSDSVLIIDKFTALDKVILIAPFVKIENGFRGNLQVFAMDSISIGKGVELKYPSALVLLKPDSAKFQPRISVGESSLVEGQLLAWEREKSLLQPMIIIGENTVIRGEIYCKGYVSLEKGATVNGSVSATRLMAKRSSTLYENYLIDVTIDRTKLSPYYLSPNLLPGRTLKRKILCHLN